MNFKRLALTPLILAKYGKLNPTSVRMPGCMHAISINPQDGRAYKKLVMDTVRGRISTPAQFFRDHVEKLKPAAALDIGSNYGECFCYTRFGVETTCIAVEGNNTLRPYLERTRMGHPDATRIAVETCLLGDTDHQQGALYFDVKWTGGGSAAPEHEDMSVSKVETRTADSLLAQHGIADGAIVFKMDVEGYEGKVINGFTRLFESKAVAGILEFDTLMLKRAGTNSQELFSKLSKKFLVYKATKHKKLVETSWEILSANGDFHCDLAVFSDKSLIAEGWLS
jgi:FkbM family methyltransferase